MPALIHRSITWPASHGTVRNALASAVTERARYSGPALVPTETPRGRTDAMVAVPPDSWATRLIAEAVGGATSKHHIAVQVVDPPLEET